MSYPQGGYQQQPWQQGGGQPGQPGQPGPAGQGGYGGGYNYPAQRAGSPATAIIAGILGLAVTVLLAIAGFEWLGDLSDAPDGFEVPAEYTIIIILLFAAAVVCLIGAIITFVRKVAGAFVLLIGAIVTLAAVLLQPVLLSSLAQGADVSFGDFIKELFKFETTRFTCEAIALICAPILLIFSVIPPTLNWLRGSGQPAQPYGGYPQQGGYQNW